jgi:hypothetical protein
VSRGCLRCIIETVTSTTMTAVARAKLRESGNGTRQHCALGPSASPPTDCLLTLLSPPIESLIYILVTKLKDECLVDAIGKF